MGDVSNRVVKEIKRRIFYTYITIVLVGATNRTFTQLAILLELRSRGSPNLNETLISVV
jgi:hypothetical protein